MDETPTDGIGVIRLCPWAWVTGLNPECVNFSDCEMSPACGTRGGGLSDPPSSICYWALHTGLAYDLLSSVWISPNTSLAGVRGSPEWQNKYSVLILISPYAGLSASRGAVALTHVRTVIYNSP